MKPGIANIIIKVVGDAGEYQLWGLDWANNKATIFRANSFETIPFRRIKKESMDLIKECLYGDE